MMRIITGEQGSERVSAKRVIVHGQAGLLSLSLLPSVKGREERRLQHTSHQRYVGIASKQHITSPDYPFNNEMASLGP